VGATFLPCNLADVCKVHDGTTFLPDVLTTFDRLQKNPCSVFDEIEKFWSINTMCGRCEWNARRVEGFSYHNFLKVDSTCGRNVLFCYLKHVLRAWTVVSGPGAERKHVATAYHPDVATESAHGVPGLLYLYT
jgi:hypothetical protein